jgi:hypothetical protein
MPNEPNSEPSNLDEQLAALKPKDKAPASMAILNKWIAQAERRLGTEVKGGRLGWLIASSVAVAAVQRAIDEEGHQLFLIKGGTLLLHKLGVIGRPTKDVDGMVRGNLDDFFAKLDEALDEPWGPLALRRGPVEEIAVPSKRIKPRSFEIILEFKGETWRRVKFEVSPDEANISHEPETITPTALHAVGLPDPQTLVGIAFKNQIAQKLHGATSKHGLPDYKNDRSRDVVDLLLIHDMVESTGAWTNAEIKAAAEKLFAARADEASEFNRDSPVWPSKIIIYPHWYGDNKEAAEATGVTTPLEEAVVIVNAWIDTIAAS